ncbi:hypothetical protein ALC53_03897 [Atta colombica]|uniref:Uncharacterized protein n=1 Tax=Atta colombica TaxID=520822 RepID=A0A195BLX7_9HYME|nr:hypothetical protein ALC53_03897 [Atta colombica]
MSPLAQMQVAKRQLSSRELRTSCFDYPLAFLPARRFSEETKLPEMPPRHFQPPPPFNLEKFQRVQISGSRAAGRIISCPCRSLCRGVALPDATLKSNKARVCSRFVKRKKREVRRGGARRAGSTSKFFREARGQRRRKKRRGKRGKDEKRTRTKKKKKNVRREREGGRKEERRREAKEDSSGTGDDGGQKTSKKAREPDSSSAFALPCPTRLALYSPRPCLCFASPRLVLPRLACACQLATRRQTRPSLSFVLMPTRLHASVFLVVVFLFTLANLNPGPSRRAAASSLATLRSRLSLPRSRKREPFRSPVALLALSERACKRNGKAI